MLSEPIRLNEFCESFVTEIKSRKGVKKAIKRGEVLLNDKKAEGGEWLVSGDEIALVDTELTPPKTYYLKLDVVFEDEDLAVIVKPAGITVSGNQFKTIQNALAPNLKLSAKEDKLPWALPVHRLDNQTSGLLIVAKTKTARVRLGQAFESKKIQKTYCALVIGKPEKEGMVELPIDGKKSTSLYKLIETVPSLKSSYLSLLELKPLTGRTHQLRIHCAHLGTPILGDKIYGKEGMILKNKGLFLAAVGLLFEHPVTNKKMTFALPIPHKFMKRMENESRRFYSHVKKS